jgi:hypothetical protein
VNPRSRNDDETETRELNVAIALNQSSVVCQSKRCRLTSSIHVMMESAKGLFRSRGMIGLPGVFGFEQNGRRIPRFRVKTLWSMSSAK